MKTLRQAAISLARTPGFAFAVIATFALGIGVNTAIFSAAWSLLLGPLPLREPDRLVRIHETSAADRSRPVAPANFLDLRREAKSLVGAASYFQINRVYDSGGEPQRISVSIVSSQYFDVLGATPLAGRFFRGGESRPLAVVTERFWRDRLSAGPLEGRTVRLDGESYDVVGVAPASFALPSGTQVWTVAKDDVARLSMVTDFDPTMFRGARYLGVYGRLAPGATVASADAEIAAIAARLEREFPDNRGCGARVEALAADLGAQVGRPVALLAGGSAAMLLLTCANVAGLFLARSLARRREIAVRAALGAGRAGLVGRAVAESWILALVGGALGIGLAAWGAPLLVKSLPGADAAGRIVGVPLVAVAFAALLATAAAFAAAIAPTLGALRVPAAVALAAARGALGPSRSRLRTALVVAQAAVAALLVVSALLVARSLARLVAVDPGFDANGVVTTRLWAPSRSDFPRERRAELLERAVAAAKTAPGVADAGGILKLPLTGASFSAGLTIDGIPFEEGEEPDVCWRVVTDDYFTTLGIPLVAGRGFAPADTRGELVALVNRTLALRFWPGESAVGRRIRTGLDAESGWVTIVGVVGDTPQTDLVTPAAPEMYRPLGQPNRFGSETVVLAVRTSPGFSAEVLRERVRSVSPELVLDDDVPLANVVRKATANERLLGTLLASFGLVALILAGIGLYGVLALLVAERRRELGLRMAVGATSRDLGAYVVRRAALQALLGAAIGLPAALAAGRLLRAWLHEISPSDPWSLGGAVAALAAAALAASWLPARRAARTDPATVLRDE